jgi:hypothetical protein
MTTKRKSIGVEAMDGMSREQVKWTNIVASALIVRHHMCQDCAINMAVAMVWSGFLGPKKGSRPGYQSSETCSEACRGALKEFLEETLECTRRTVEIEQMPSRQH